MQSSLNENLSGYEFVSRTIDNQTGEVIGEEKVLSKTGDEPVVLSFDNPVGLPSFGKEAQREELYLDGETEPYALVKITLRSDPIVKVSRADADGKWTMTVPVDLLEEGEHTAYLETNAQGVRSEEVEIANFIIVEEQKLSNTTWIFIINVGIAILVLVVVLLLQLTRKKDDNSGTGTAKKQVTTEIKEKDSITDTDGSDTHSALGV